MGNLFGRYEETDMAECSSTTSSTAQHGPSTSRAGQNGQKRRGAPRRLSTSSSSSASSSDDEISEVDEHYKRAMVEAWVSDVALAMDVGLADKEPWLGASGSRAGSVYSWRGGVDGRPRGNEGRQVGARNTKFESSTHLGAYHVDANSVTPMRENRVYVVNVNGGEGRNGDLTQNRSAAGRNDVEGRRSSAFIEEITQGEYRRRMAPDWRRSPNRRVETYPDPGERAGTTPRVLAKTEGGANSGQNGNTRVRGVCKTSSQFLEAPRRGTEQPLKASTSCVDSTRCLPGLEYVVDEPVRLMNRENRPVGDCVPDRQDARSQNRTTRSYEYRRDFRESKGEGTPREGGECQQPNGCQHCSSKMPFLRC